MLKSTLNLFPLVALVVCVSAPAMAGPARVIPYAGVIDKNGAPFSGLATLNFALFDCAAQNGACDGSSTQLYVASGSGTFPPANATGIALTPNDGRFSVLIGDTGMAALPLSVFATQQLFVRIAIKASDNSWIPLTGFQRIAPVASAISAEEAQTFTVRQNLTVVGTTTLSGGLTSTGPTTLGTTQASSVTTPGFVVGRFISGTASDSSVTAPVINGTTSMSAPVVNASNSISAPTITATTGQLRSNVGADIDGALNVDGNTTLRGLDLQLNLSLNATNGQIFLQNRPLFLRTVNDSQHGLQHRSSFAGVAMDGPALWGFNGGVLGSGTGGNERIALSWKNSGKVNFAQSPEVEGLPMFIVCERNVVETRGSGGNSFQFSAAECGGRFVPPGYVGFASRVDICNGSITFDVFPHVPNVTFAGVRWFATSGCNNGDYKVRAVYVRP